MAKKSSATCSVKGGDRNSAGRELAVEKSEIVHRREFKTSMMPEGLLASLTDQEISDLCLEILSTPVLSSSSAGQAKMSVMTLPPLGPVRRWLRPSWWKVRASGWRPIKWRMVAWRSRKCIFPLTARPPVSSVAPWV
jgi:hypothetical protein